MIITRRQELLALFAILGVATIVLSRQIGQASAEFDEQVYLASADLLTRGFALGRDVFTSQPPLFLSVLGQADSAVGGNAATLRIMLVLLTLCGATAAWAIVRSRAGALAGLLTALLVALAPGVVEAAAVVSADVPSVALGTLALLAANAACTRPGWALAAGILICCALLTKFLAAPFVIAIAVTAIARRPPQIAYAWFATGVTACAAVALFVYADVLGPLWNGAVALHLQARDAKVELPPQDILLEVLLSISALLAAGFALCAVQRPLLNHHLVIVAWPLALLAGSALPRDNADSRRTLVLVAAGLGMIAPWAIQGRATIDTDSRQSLRPVADVVVRATPTDAIIVSDLPAVPVLAGRTPSLATVDPSYVRVQTGELSAAEIAAAADDADAAVIGRAFRGVPGLDKTLRRRFTQTTMYRGVAIWTQPRPRESQSDHRLMTADSQ